MSAYAMAILTPKQAFLALQRDWDERLRRLGFRDIEKRLPSGAYADLLSGGQLPGSYTRDVVEARYEYFAKARRFALYYTAFPSETYRKVWTLYGEGLTYREIGVRIGRDHSRAARMVTRLLPEFRAWVDTEGSEA